MPAGRHTVVYRVGHLRQPQGEAVRHDSLDGILWCTWCTPQYTWCTAVYVVYTTVYVVYSGVRGVHHSIRGVQRCTAFPSSSLYRELARTAPARSVRECCELDGILWCTPQYAVQLASLYTTYTGSTKHRGAHRAIHLSAVRGTQVDRDQPIVRYELGLASVVSNDLEDAYRKNSRVSHEQHASTFDR